MARIFSVACNSISLVLPVEPADVGLMPVLSLLEWLPKSSICL